MGCVGGKYMDIFLLYLFTFPISMILVLFCHELGHALFGLWRGGHFVCIIIGPVLYGRENQSEACRFSLNKDLGLYGGVVGVAPPKEVTLKDYFYYIFGGPFMSFILSLISAPFVILTFKHVPLFVWMFLLQLCICSLVIVVVTLIPIKKRITPFSYSDGKRLFDYFKGESFYKLDYYAWKNSNVFNDEKYNYNVTECTALKESEDTIFQLVGSYNLLRYHESKDNNEKVQEELQSLKKTFQKLSRREQIAIIKEKEFKQILNM